MNPMRELFKMVFFGILIGLILAMMAFSYVECRKDGFRPIECFVGRLGK